MSPLCVTGCLTTEFCLRKNLVFPLVSVGNLTVGGTGKTPHTGIYCRYAGDGLQYCCVKSRIQAQDKRIYSCEFNSTPDSVGDEPLQIYRKFGSRVKSGCLRRSTQGDTRNDQTVSQYRTYRS